MPAQVSVRRSLVSVLVLTVGLLLSACGSGSPTPGAGPGGTQGKLSVIASFYPIAYFAERVVGDSAQVYNPVPPGAEPHDLELSPRTIERIQGSQVLLYLGGGFQPAMDRALDTLKGSGLTAVDVSEGLKREPVTGVEGQAEGGALDPHVWLDPRYAKVMVDNIESALTQADPAHGSVYKVSADKLRGELDDLDRQMADGLAGCTRKDIVTSHAAFGYLARRYGLVEVPISGLSPEAEPSPARLNEVIKLAKEHDVKYIFFETLVSPRVAEVIASEAGAQTLVLNPIEGLTEEQASAGADYFSLMRENLANLKTALDCK